MCALMCSGCVAIGRKGIADKGMIVTLKNGRIRIDHDCGLHVAVYNVRVDAVTKIEDRDKFINQLAGTLDDEDMLIIPRWVLHKLFSNVPAQIAASIAAEATKTGRVF